MRSRSPRNQEVRGAEDRNHLECGRTHYEQRSWADAFDALDARGSCVPAGNRRP